MIWMRGTRSAAHFGTSDYWISTIKVIQKLREGGREEKQEHRILDDGQLRGCLGKGGAQISQQARDTIRKAQVNAIRKKKRKINKKSHISL
mmetsp:Transcript_8320/g.23951  ORF Transcript_8320/g.23951 Transcript_8320/m.23951 type:complete len:91 (+) Transcript_8320:398-670(+)